MTGELRMSHGTQNQPADDPAPVVFVLFGATGDLARRMVLPAFYQLAREGLLPRQWLLVGNGRGDVSDEELPCPCPRCADRIRPASRSGNSGMPSRGGCSSPVAGSAADSPGSLPASWARPAGRWAGIRNSFTTWLSRPSLLPG